MWGEALAWGEQPEVGVLERRDLREKRQRGGVRRRGGGVEACRGCSIEEMCGRGLNGDSYVTQLQRCCLPVVTHVLGITASHDRRGEK